MNGNFATNLEITFFNMYGMSTVMFANQTHFKLILFECIKTMGSSNADCEINRFEYLRRNNDF